MTSLKSALLKFFFALLITLPATVLSISGRRKALEKRGKKTNPRHEKGVFFFWIFCAALASQTIFPDLLSQPVFMWPNADSLINLSIFRVFPMTLEDLKNGSYSSFMINFLGNIAIFVPMGFLPPLLWRISGLKTVGICFSVSLTIEILQLFLPRTTDIDDIWLNTLGGFLGVLLYRIYVRKKNAAETFRLPLRENER